MKNILNKVNKPEELENYIKTSLLAIKRGVGAESGFALHGLIEFDLAVTNLKSGDGRLKIFVADLRGIKKTETISRLRFKVRPTSSR